MESECLRCGAEFDDDLTYDGITRTCGKRRKLCSRHCKVRFFNSTENQRRWSFPKKYGITVEEYQALLEAQGGVCAICGQPETTVHSNTGTLWSLNVDHDHSTGRVRGLPCVPCNRGIGFLRDDPTTIRAALEYLDA